MTTVAVIMLVVVVAAAALAPERFAGWLRLLGTLGLALALAGFTFLFYGPRDYLTRWPALVGLFHPYQVILYSAGALLVGAGVWLGLLARGIFRSARSEGGSRP